MCAATRDVCYGPIADIGVSGVEDGIGYFAGNVIGISAGIDAPPSCWKVRRS
jgi:hypothetical protein